MTQELEMLREKVKYLEEKIELMERIEELKELLKQKEQIHPYAQPIILPNIPYYDKYQVYWSNCIPCKGDIIVESNNSIDFKDTQC